MIQDMHRRHPKMNIQQYMSTSILEKIFKQTGASMVDLRLSERNDRKLEFGSYSEKSEMDDMEEEILGENGNEDYI